MYVHVSERARARAIEREIEIERERERDLENKIVSSLPVSLVESLGVSHPKNVPQSA